MVIRSGFRPRPSLGIASNRSNGLDTKARMSRKNVSIAMSTPMT